MFSITPIGSCRITTSLRQAQKGFGYSLNLKRIYGYSHTAGEAVQMARFRKREYTPTPKVWPLISPTTSLGKISAEEPSYSDLYVVEISSAKEITLGEHRIQLNYLSRHFEALFSDKNLAGQFWRICQEGNTRGFDEFFHDNPILSRMPKADIDLLSQVRMRMITEDDLRKNIRELQSSLPEVIFVTHVDAKKADGSVITSRSNFIELVTECVKAEHGRLYNPTELMRSVGQIEAIEDYSASLAHYTPYFGELMVTEWFDTIISELIDNAALQDQDCLENLIVNLTARLNENSVREVESRLEKLLEKLGPLPSLFGLQARCLKIREKGQEARRVLNRSLELFPNDNDLLRQHADICMVEAEYHEAAGSIDRLIDQGNPPPSHMLFELAENLKFSCRQSRLFQYYELAFDEDPSLIAAAQRAISLASTTQNKKVMLHYRHLVADPPPGLDINTLMKLAISTKSEDKLSSLLDLLALRSASDLSAALAFLNDRGFRAVISQTIARQRTANGNILAQRSDMRALISGWVEIMDRAANPQEISRLISHILLADPGNSAARNQQRKLHRELRIGARAAYRDKDVATLKELLIVAKELGLVISDISIFLSQLYFAGQDWQNAKDAARDALGNMGDNVLAWAMIMRCDLGLQDYPAALEAAQKVLDFSTPDTEKLFNEATMRISRIPSLCLKVARLSDDPFDVLTLIKIVKNAPNLIEKTKGIEIRAKRSILNTLRELSKARSNGALAYADKALAFMPNDEKIQLLTARLLVNNRRYKEAMPIWDTLLVGEPDNTDIIFQRQRCATRVNKADA